MGKNPISFLFKSNFNPKLTLKSLSVYNEIKESDLFDEEFYLKTYSNINGDPLTYYLFEGYKLGHFPSLKFNPDLYLERYGDVKESEINPLLHYFVNGKKENRVYDKVLVDSRKKEICRTNLALLNNFEFENEPLISIIILNRDGLHHLKRLFKDFDKKTNYSNYEIIVVDNASTDGSVEFLKSLDLPIAVIENKENVSFSKGNNDAAKIAKGKFLLLLNNDIEPTYGWLNELVGTIMQDENIAIVGAKLVFPYYFEGQRENSYKIQHCGVIFAERMKPCCAYAKNQSSDLEIFHPSLNKIKPVVAVTAAVALIRKDIYEEVGGLDEKYNYGLEDIDFSLKIHKYGYMTVYSGPTLLFHHESSTRIKTDDYIDNDRKNHNVFLGKWRNYLSKHLLIDKIHHNKFFSEKQLKICFIGQPNQFISNLAKQFNDLGYEVDLIADYNDTYLGNSSDILLSFTDEYDLSKIVSRRDLLKVYVENEKVEGYNLILNENNIDFNNFTTEFLEIIENLINQKDFEWD